MRSRQNRIRQVPDPSPEDRALESKEEMSLKTEKYTRRPFDVDAVQVTPENMLAIAEWVKGEIVTEKRGRLLVQYVKVDVAKAIKERQGRAYNDDWVLHSSTGFKVYLPKAFATCFQKVEAQMSLFDEAVEAKIDQFERVRTNV